MKSIAFNEIRDMNIFHHLPIEVQVALGLIFLALVAATVIVFVRCKLQPQRDSTELAQRMQTWWVIAGLFGISLSLPQWGFLTFFAFVSFLALKEYLSLIPTRRADRRVLFWAYLSIPLQYYWVSLGWYGMFIIFIPVYMFLLIPTRMVLTGQTQGFLKSAGVVHWGLMTTVFSLSHAAYLLVLKTSETSRIMPDWPTAESAAQPGPGLLIFLVVLTQLNDVSQYVWGKTFGKRKIAPQVSPGKTWAGFVGGVATTLVLAMIIGPRLTLLNVPWAAAAGLIIGVTGFLGDLSISAIKRDLGVKDSSNLLPGHGGILDRADSLTFTAPLFFHFIYYCYF